jgi:peptidoglycan hydrolase-like protein with peptidoglycan-binding domain
MRVAAIVIGLAVAGLLAAASVTIPADAAPQKAAAKRPASAGKKPRDAASPKTAASAAEQTGAVRRRAGKGRKVGAAKVAPVTAAEAQAYAAMPEGERLGIQSDLAWVRLFEGVESGDLEARTIAAIKAFQRRNNTKETGLLTVEERGLLAAAAKGPEAAVGWQLIEDSSTGARLGLPQKIVPVSSSWRGGNRWTSAQGQIRIETFRLTEAALPALFEDEKKTAQRRVEWSEFKPDSFIISGVQGLKNFLMRAEARGSELRGVTVLYDLATAGTMGTVAVAVINTFQGFPDPNAGPLPGLRRSVEYGSAIVVSGSGDLIASAEVTDECQAITVPGLGHAERVAPDKTSDLALLRVYGARNLVPAALAGESRDDDVTLVGVADPLSQAGGDAVTRISARLAGQALDPAPKLGFAGAAAVDAQGRLLGMVDFKTPVVAAAGSVGQQATLVPATTIRAFLQAHGVGNGASAEHGGIEQSVMRVICVRK